MEAAARQLHLKFSAAKTVLRVAPPHVGEQHAFALEALGAQLDAIEVSYALGTCHLHLHAAAGDAARGEAAAEYTRVLLSSDYGGDADRLMEAARGIIEAGGVILRPLDPPPRAGRGVRASARGQAEPRARARKCPPRVAARRIAEVQNALDRYPNGRLAAEAPPRAGADSCGACGGSTVVDAKRSELRCERLGCGAVSKLVGVIFDDSQFYCQEGQKAKSGTFNPNRHFSYWWVHLLAREPLEEIGNRDDPDDLIGEKLVAELRKCAHRRRILLQRITVCDMRQMLYELGRTNLNKNVSLLLKLVTGIGPPQISMAIEVRVEGLFSAAIEARALVVVNVAPDADSDKIRVNRSYYPFYILKILEQVFDEQNAGDDIRRLIYYIYVQSDDTVTADDLEWQQICEAEPALVYRPTDRRLWERYMPD